MITVLMGECVQLQKRPLVTERQGMAWVGGRCGMRTKPVPCVPCPTTLLWGFQVGLGCELLLLCCWASRATRLRSHGECQGHMGECQGHMGSAHRKIRNLSFLFVLICTPDGLPNKTSSVLALQSTQHFKMETALDGQWEWMLLLRA